MTTDSVLDDPGELLRFWLWHEYRHTVRSFKMANLAKALGAKPAAVSAWLARHAIPSYYWNPIARHFKGDTASYHLLEAEAAALWRSPASRRGYVPLRMLQKKRRELTSLRTAAMGLQLEHPETPELVADYLRQSGAAKKPRQRRPSAHRGAAQKGHGKRARV